MQKDNYQEIQKELEKTIEEKKELEYKYQQLLFEKQKKEKESGEEIERIKSQFQLLTDSLPVSIVYVDTEIKYQFANKTALKWRKGPFEDITNKYVIDVVGEEAYKSASKFVTQALSGEQVKFESLITYPDQKRYAESQYIPHFVNGKIVGFYGLVRDITEQVEARKEAERQKKRLIDLFTQAPAAICMLSGPDLVFEMVNPMYQQLFSNRTLLGKPFLDALPELKDHKLYQTFINVYNTGITHEELGMLVPISRKLNGPIEDSYFNYIQQARYDENDQIDGVVVFAFEVTEQEKAKIMLETSERNLQELAKELSASNEELAAANEEIQASNDELSLVNNRLLSVNSDLDNFVYTASHDLKAPISNIEGLMRALIRNLPPEVITKDNPKKITDMILISVERFQKTLADLTTVTKLQRGFSETPSLINLEEVIDEVKLDLNTLIEEFDVEIILDLSEAPYILFSRKNLRSIIYNLLSNAIKYHSPERKPIVKISSRKTEEYDVVSVEDNGLGMNIDNPSRIFEMFKRLHSHVEGSGIGLYIVKKIVDSAGGKIEVNTQSGKGSVLKVCFKSLKG